MAVLLTATDMIDQKNQLREVAQCQKYSKTADEVEKKVTTFGENIHLEKFRPYTIRCYYIESAKNISVDAELNQI